MVDVMTIWGDDGKKNFVNTIWLCIFVKHMLCSNRPTQRISYSLFCKLRPVNVPVIGDSPKDQCKCLTHEYFLFKLDALEYEVRCLSLPYAVATPGYFCTQL